MAASSRTVATERLIQTILKWQAKLPKGSIYRNVSAREVANYRMAGHGGSLRQVMYCFGQRESCIDRGYSFEHEPDYDMTTENSCQRQRNGTIKHHEWCDVPERFATLDRKLGQIQNRLGKDHPTTVALHERWLELQETECPATPYQLVMMRPGDGHYHSYGGDTPMDELAAELEVAGEYMRGKPSTAESQGLILLKWLRKNEKAVRDAIIGPSKHVVFLPRRAPISKLPEFDVDLPSKDWKPASVRASFRGRSRPGGYSRTITRQVQEELALGYSYMGRARGKLKFEYGGVTTELLAGSGEEPRYFFVVTVEVALPAGVASREEMQPKPGVAGWERIKIRGYLSIDVMEVGWKRLSHWRAHFSGGYEINNDEEMLAHLKGVGLRWPYFAGHDTELDAYLTGESQPGPATTIQIDMES